MGGKILYAETRGDGAPLVLISGGGGDAGMYDDAAPLLATRYQAITYDRRGNSRSPLPTPGAAVHAAAQADDVVDLLDRYDLEKAAVFGSSAGALIALELLSRHADRLTRVVVHEPPAVQLLPKDSREYQELIAIRRLAEDKGAMRGFAAFGAMTMAAPSWLFRSPTGQAFVAAGSRAMAGVGTAARTLTRRPPSTMSRLLGNVPILMERELGAFLQYEPDPTALTAVDVPWVLATGVDSVGKPYHRPARILAELTGVPCVEFPGGHTVYQTAPRQFADRLSIVLEDLCHAQD